MSKRTDSYRDLTQSVSAGLSTLRSSTPEVMKSFSDLGRAATADGVLDKKTKELIALALSVAARCDPCIGFHAQTLVKLGATRQEIDETLGVTTYMGGGPFGPATPHRRRKRAWRRVLRHLAKGEAACRPTPWDCGRASESLNGRGGFSAEKCRTPSVEPDR